MSNEKDAEIDDDSIENSMIVKEGRVGNVEFCKSMVTTKEQKSESKLETEPEQAKSIEQGKTWQGDWGSSIVAIVSSQPCGDKELISQNYNYLMSVSIPKARLKKPNDAWQVVGDRAVTITGCWTQKPDNMIHAKLTKKNGKTWEQDFKMTDGNWTAK
jgi:hypothetical protein